MTISIARQKLAGICTHLGAFLVPILIFLVGMWRAGMAPFGDISILLWDMDIQYVDLFGWLKNVLSGDGSFFYSAGKSLGGNMWGVFSYYLGNPLNLLVVFFPQESLQDFVRLLTLLKIGLCGLTCSFFLKYRFRLGRVWTVVLSGCYALMQYVLYQASNIMWLDGVMWLPLVMLGVYRLVWMERPLLLCISLFACISSNWYTGYMICLFTVLFYLYEEFLAGQAHTARSLKHSAGRFVQFGGFGLLTAGCCGFTLLPTIISMLLGKGQVEENLWEPDFRLPLLDTLKNVFIGTRGGEQAPSLYVGMLVLLLCILYFFNRAFSKKERVVTGLLLAFMLLSTCFYPLEKTWNGLRTVYSYYCRFAFLVCFLLLYIAAKSLTQLRMLTVRNLLAGCGVVVGIGVFFHSLKGYSNPFYVYLSLVVAGAFAFILHALIRGDNSRRARVWAAACVALAILELTLNTQNATRALYTSVPEERYTSYTVQSKEQLARLKEADPSVYRVEKTYSRLTNENTILQTPTAFTNESLSLGYRGLTHYSSTYDQNVVDLLVALGYCQPTRITTKYNEAILVSDSLLGIKYVSSKDCPAGFVPTGLPSTQTGETFYENPYALPLGYAADKAVLTSSPQTDGNPFAYQNAFVSAILGEETACFKPLKVQAVETEEGALAWIADVPQGALVYGYIHTTAPRSEADLYIDGSLRERYFHWLSHHVFSIGSYDQPHTASIRIENSVNAAAEYTCYVYMLDMPVFEKAIERLRASGFEPDVWEDGYISGQYEADGDGYLLLTVPSAPGWTVRVNGGKVEPKTAWNALTAIPVNAGANTITMSYVSPGFLAGTVVTLVSAALLAALLAIVRRRRKRQVNGAPPGDNGQQP